jgi:hypothetical protein
MLTQLQTQLSMYPDKPATLKRIVASNICFGEYGVARHCKTMPVSSLWIAWCHESYPQAKLPKRRSVPLASSPSCIKINFHLDSASTGSHVTFSRASLSSTSYYTLCIQVAAKQLLQESPSSNSKETSQHPRRRAQVSSPPSRET